MRRRQELFVHLVWSTSDRAPLIEPEVQAWLWPMLGNEFRRLGCPWAVVGGVATHVHVLCAMPATVAVADLVKQAKGAASRCATERGHALKWQGGYGAFTVSPDAVPRVEAYVRHQPEHHMQGTGRDEWE